MRIGQLTFEMAANIARLRTDMDAARRSVDSTMRSIQNSVDGAKKALAGLGVVVSAGAFAAWIKNAIDAADETSKLSQKIGIATQDIAGLQLAFRQSGLEANALQISMTKLAVQIADNGKALQAMGVSTRNADGSLRSTREVLAQVADRFESYADGAAKAALAVELFGKAGADMIPLLNGGSEALAEFDALAERLGLTIDGTTAKQAEKFNDTLDLMGQGFQGIAQRIAANLLPALSGLADEFFRTMTEGDRLRTVSDQLAVSMRGLYVIASAVTAVFSGVGRTVGGLAAAISADLSGNTKGAIEILRQLREDNERGWSSTADSISRAWNTTGSAAVEAMATTVAATKKAAPVLVDIQKKTERIAKTEDDLLAIIKEAQKRDEERFEAEARWSLARERAVEQAEAAADQQIKTAQELLEQIEFETAALKMTNQEREVAIALRRLESAGIVEGTTAYEAYGEAIRKAIIDREAVRQSLEQVKEIGGELRQETDTVGQALANALMQGGKSAAEYIKGLFRSMVLQPILRAVVMPVTGAIGGAISGAASASTGASVASNGLSAIGLAASSFGQFAATGFMNTLVGTGASAGLTASSALMAGGATSSGIGMALGAVAPYALAAAAVVALLKKGFGRELVDRGIQGEFNRSGFAGSGYEDFKGGFLRSDSSNATAMDSELQTRLSSSYQALRDSVAVLAEQLGVARDGFDAISQPLRLSFQGLSEDQIKERFAGVFDVLGNTLADLIPGLRAYSREGEGQLQTLTRLSGSISSVNPILSTLNLKLFDTSLSGAGAADAMVTLFGGIENFTQATGFFYENFYSQAERTAKTTEQLTTALASMGLALPETREQFRAMVEAARAAGDDQLFARLMNLAPAFASITESAGNLADSVGGLEQSLRSAADIAQERASLEQDLLQVTGNVGLLRRREREQLDESNRELFDRINLIKDEQATNQQQVGILRERRGLEQTLLQAAGDTVELRRREREALDESNRALFDRVTALTDERAALEAQQRAAEQAYDDAIRAAQDAYAERKRVLDQGAAVEARLLQALGDTTALRERELSTLDESSRALMRQLYALEDQRAAADKARQATQAASAALQRAIEAQREAVENQRRAAEQSKENAQKQLDAARSVAEFLDTQIRTLRGQGGALGEDRAASMQAILAAVAQSRAGQIPELESLSRAVSAVVAGMDETVYASAFEARRDRLVLAGRLSEIRGAAQTQMTVAERQLAAAEAQIAQFDQVLAKQQAQVDALLGVNESVLSVEQAVSALKAAQAAESRATAAVTGAEDRARAAVIEAERARLAAEQQAAAIRDEAERVAAQALAAETLIISSTLSKILIEMQRLVLESSATPTPATPVETQSYFQKYSDVADAYRADNFGMTPQQFALEHWLKHGDEEGRDFPTFAAGGLHSGGMRLVGERGPELEVSGPARYFSRAATQQMLGGEAASELRSLREENRAQARALVGLQTRMTRLLERWDGDGLPAERVEA